MSERDEDKRLAEWFAEKRLLADLIEYTIKRAPRCTVGACRCVAHWSVSSRGASGSARDELLCDRHKSPASTPLEGDDVVRRAQNLLR